jgi:hypothetical protein
LPQSLHLLPWLLPLLQQMQGQATARLVALSLLSLCLQHHLPLTLQTPQLLYLTQGALLHHYLLYLKPHPAVPRCFDQGLTLLLLLQPPRKLPLELPHWASY